VPFHCDIENMSAAILKWCFVRSDATDW